MGFSFGSVFLRMGLHSSAEEASIDAITLFVLLLCSCIVIGHLLEKNRWVTESITALALGLIAGTIILLTTEGRRSHILVFNEEIFFIYLLPPIIFNAGFQVKKKQFFMNFITIMVFGAVGTLISFFIISFADNPDAIFAYSVMIFILILKDIFLKEKGSLLLFKRLGIDFLDVADYLALGAIFSATDSVCTLQLLNQEDTPLLYSLVFGEGVVNDATSVVLFNAIQRFDLSHITPAIFINFAGNFLYLFLTSTFLGVAVGLLSAYVIKKLYFGRHSTDREVALMMLMAYLSYMVAELFGLSGILTVFFCGIVMSHYTWHNVTESSRITTKHAFATFSFVSEIFIFLYVGMDALDMEKWKFVSKSPGISVGVSSILLFLVLLGRAAFVFPFSFLSNLTKKSQSNKIGYKQQVTIWWAGLMRGAVSIALAYKQFTVSGHTQLRGNAVMITSTISVVLFTNLVGGFLTKALKRFLLPLNKHSCNEMSSEILSRSLTRPLLTNGQDSESDMSYANFPRPTSLKMLLSMPTRSVHYYWRRFDDAFMRPVFGGRGFLPFIPGTPREMIVQ